MSAVAHESGLSAKEALQQQRQEAIDFVTQATSLGNAESVTAEDLARRNARNKDFAAVLCDDNRYAADARWRRMRRRLYDQLAQRRVDLTKAVCGPTATTAFFVGDASFTSNRRMRQIVKWEELRTTFARFGYSFSVPEFNTSALVSCCLAPVEHPVRETTKFESQRKFRARVDMAKSEKGKSEGAAALWQALHPRPLRGLLVLAVHSVPPHARARHVLCRAHQLSRHRHDGHRAQARRPLAAARGQLGRLGLAQDQLIRPAMCRSSELPCKWNRVAPAPAHAPISDHLT